MESSTKPSSHFVFFLVLILSLAAPTFIAYLVTVDWGFNQVLSLPRPFFILWAGLALLLIIFALTQNRRIDAVGFLERYLWGDRKKWGRWLAALLILSLFFLLKYEAQLYGNSYLRVGNLAQKTIPIFRWFEYGSTLIIYPLYYLIQLTGVVKETAALWAYQLFSIGSGLVFWMITFRLSERLFAEIRNRLLFLGLLLCSGLSFLFFGMVENTPVLLPLTAWLIYAAAGYYKSRRGRDLVLLWIITAVGLFMDITFAAALAPLVYVTVQHRRTKKEAGDTAAILAGAGAAAIIVAITYLLAAGDIAIEKRLLYLSAKKPDMDYSLFSPHHLLDLVNLLFMALPMILILLGTILRADKKSSEGQPARFLLMLAAGQGVVLFLLDPKSGMARDIHLFLTLLSGLIFWGALILTRSMAGLELSERFKARIVPMAFVLIVPFYAVHLHAAATVKYIGEFLTYNENKYEAALYAFRDYYFMSGDYAEADKSERDITGKVTGFLESKLVNDLFYAKKIDEAFSYANRLVERDPYHATYRMQRGNLYKHMKKYDLAEEELKVALALEPATPELYHFLSEVYRDTNREKDCLEILQQGLTIDPSDPQLLVDLAAYHFRRRDFAQSDLFADRAMVADPEKPYPYMYKAMVAERTGRLPESYNFFNEFVKRAEGLPEHAYARKKMNEIYLQIFDTTGVGKE